VAKDWQSGLKCSHRRLERIAKWDEVLSLTCADSQIEAALTDVLERQRGSGEVRRQDGESRQ
jgi:hypothetical protein